MFMIEGIWTGYTSSQSHVVHREYGKKKWAEQVRAAIPYSILYTDGTALIIHIFEVARRKKPEIRGYTELIRDCVAQGVCRVTDLRKEP